MRQTRIQLKKGKSDTGGDGGFYAHKTPITGKTWKTASYAEIRDRKGQNGQKQT